MNSPQLATFSTIITVRLNAAALSDRLSGLDEHLPLAGNRLRKIAWPFLTSSR